MADRAFIRQARAGDGPRLLELMDTALRLRGEQDRKNDLAERCEEGEEDALALNVEGVDFPILLSVRVMDRGDGEVVGFVYCCPPMGWITKRSGVPRGVQRRVSAALSEVQMIAVRQGYRQRGYASRLLADCEERFQAAGYRVLSLTIDRAPRSLTAWYERRGYRFGGPGEPGWIKYWDRREMTSLHGDVSKSQCLGYKPLASGVEAGDMIVSAPRWRHGLLHVEAVPHTWSVQSLITVTGMLAP